MELDYKILISSYLSGNFSDDEEKTLKEWISKDIEHARIFEEMQQTWVASSMLHSSHRFSSKQALNKIRPILGNSGYQKSFFITSREINLKQALKIAASFLLIFIAGGLISFFITKSLYSGNSKGMCYVEAPIGSRAVASLPDGTKIWLNAGSRIEYSTDFNKCDRTLTLKGEGYFKVKTNPAKPFYVKANNVTIKATGTAFNVKAYPDEKQVTTTLVEGKVELYGKGLNNQSFTYNMKPKQKVTYYNDDKLFAAVRSEKNQIREKSPTTRKNEKVDIPLVTKAPIVANTDVKTELYTSWKDERWVIESENLADLAILFERRYNVSITFANNEIKNYRFCATIQNETIEQIFDIMRLTLPISYEADKGKIILKTDKTLKKIYKAAYQNTNN
jgi:ferric-dicitrate binding protein FerR (iron transport regulator)